MACSVNYKAVTPGEAAPGWPRIQAGHPSQSQVRTRGWLRGVGGGMEQGCWGRLEADETPSDLGSDTRTHVSLCISHATIIFWHYIF